MIYSLRPWITLERATCLVPRPHGDITRRGHSTWGGGYKADIASRVVVLHPSIHCKICLKSVLIRYLYMLFDCPLDAKLSNPIRISVPFQPYGWLYYHERILCSFRCKGVRAQAQGSVNTRVQPMNPNPPPPRQMTA